MLAIDFDSLKSKKKGVYWVNNEEIIVRLQGKNVYAYAGLCPHQGGPLAQGKVRAGKLFCPWHGCCFDMGAGVCIDTGSCRNVRKEDVKLKRFKCTINEGMVYVDEKKVL